MATLAQVRTRINDFLTARWPALVNMQDSYFSSKGRYFQGLWTHTAQIDQTTDNDTLADRLDDKPTDQTHSWRDRIGNALDATLFPARLRIDVYDGPRGKGWVATVQMKYGGILYERSKNVGPETYRTQPWRDVSTGTEIQTDNVVVAAAKTAWAKVKAWFA
jgi:hypothetical protein